MPSLSSAFQKLKLRRSSNPPSPNSSLKDGHKHHRGSTDSPRGSVDVARVESDHPTTGYGNQVPVGAGDHVEGKTEVAKNINEQFEHGFHVTPSKSHQSGSSAGAGVGETPRSPLHREENHSRTGSMDQKRIRSEEITKTLPPLPGSEHNKHGISAGHGNGADQAQFDADGFPISHTNSLHSNNTTTDPIVPGRARKNSIPRSYKTFDLPVVEKSTPFSSEVAAGLENRAGKGSSTRGQQVEARGVKDRSILSTGTGSGSVTGSGSGKGFALMSHEKEAMGYYSASLNGLKERDQIHSATRGAEWKDQHVRPIEMEHHLTQPLQILPVSLPNHDSILAESRQFIRGGSVGTKGEHTAAGNKIHSTVITGPTNPAYVASRAYSFNPSHEASEDEHQAHIAKHLALLQNKLFNPQATASYSAVRPGKILPLKAGPLVPLASRDETLLAQRDQLISHIVSSEQLAEKEGRRAHKGKDGLDERTIESFTRAGWEKRLGVLDTIDFKTRTLEPVIQEHIVPIETEIMEVIIFRDIHKYHIYPYIQPIHDPNPTVLPTRHLFKDSQGNWREVIGDEAAERILGHKLDRSEGRYYEERWTEGVTGIEYSAIEKESVEIGRRGWVKLVGERLVAGRTLEGKDSNYSSLTQPHHSYPAQGSEPVPISGHKPRQSSFSSTSPGRPVHRSENTSPLPNNSLDRSAPSSSQIGRAF